MKKRRYAGGGDIREEENENIGSDTRARAMEFLRTGKGSGQAAPSTEPDVPTKRAAAVPKPMPAAKPAAKAASSASEDDPSIPKATGRSAEQVRAMADADKPGMARRAMNAAFPSRSFPGQGPESSLPAVGGVAIPRVARGVGNVAGGLASAAKKGWDAGEASKAASRAAEQKAFADKSETLARTARRAVSEDRSARADALAEAKRTAAAQKAAGRSERGSPSVERMEGEGGMPARAARSERYTSPRSTRERSLEEERMQGEGGRYAKGGRVTRGDGIAKRGATRGRIC